MQNSSLRHQYPTRAKTTALIDPATWASAPSNTSLSASAVDIWIAELTEIAAHEFGAFLSPDELERANRFRFDKDRNRYVAGRGILRSILGNYLGTEPARLQFRYNPYGKPYLANQKSDVQFNVAHSEELALFALTVGRELGVDLERIRDDFVTEELAERFFAPDEVKVLMSLPPAYQRRAFFECWTRKEAFIKARGMGLSLPLDQFTVAFGPTASPAVLSARDDPEAQTKWFMHDLQPAEGYTGALVVEAGDSKLNLWRFELPRSTGAKT